MTTLAQADSSDAAKRLLVPSVRDIIFVFLFWSLLAGVLSARPLADLDIGWHIRTGEQILRTHSFPRTDPYSTLMQGQPWFAWEWLYDVLLGVLHQHCGLNGVVWLCALIVASTFTMLLWQLLARGTGLLLAIALMLITECAATIHLLARPHIVSWIFVLIWFVGLERWRRGNDASGSVAGIGFPGERTTGHGTRLDRWLLAFLPLSMILWVNLHGGWIMGLALMAIYLFSSLVESWREHDPFVSVRITHRARALAWSLLAAAGATFINPYGWHLHTHIYRYLSDRYLMDRISEFRPADFHGWPARCFAIILALTLVAFSRRPRRVRIHHLLVALLAIYTGLYSARSLPTACILLTLLIGPMLSGEIAAIAAGSGARTRLHGLLARMSSFSERMAEQELELRGHPLPILFVIATLAICWHGGYLGSRQLIHAQFDPKVVPAAAVDFLAEEASPAPIFCPDSWGGYLIYRLYPQRQVVVDDRHDLFGSERVRRVLILMQGEPGWEHILDDLELQTVLLPADSTLANLLREMPHEWSAKYQDSIAVVFEKRAR